MMVKTLACFLLTAHGVFAVLDGMVEHIRAQCKSVGAEDKTFEVATAYVSYRQCIIGLIDSEHLRKTFINENQNRVFEELALGVCSKKSELISCYNVFLDGMSPCLDNASQTLNAEISTKKNIGLLVDHACDSLSEFTAANGFECVVGKMESIKKDCLTENVVGSPEYLAGLSNDEQCVLFDKISKCAMRKLTTCGPVVYGIEETFTRDLRALFSCTNSPTSAVTSLPLLW